MNNYVTVYILNHNYGQYLKQAIESVLEQTYSFIEIIIIDDGSTDDSVEILDNFEKIKNIKIVRQKNQGLIKCNNIALNLSTGEFIIRLDADDYLHPNAIEYLVKALKSKPTASLAYANYFEIDANGRIKREIILDNDKELRNVLETPMHGACTLFRKSDLVESGGYDENFTRQDGYYIWLFFNDINKIVHVNFPIFYYRKHRNNLTNDTNLLLETRSYITKKHLELRNLNVPPIITVIPIGDHFLEDDNHPLGKLKNKPLIDWTLEQALKLDGSIKTIVSTSSLDLIEYIETNFPQIEINFRKSNVSFLADSYIDAVRESTYNYQNCFEYVFILEIENPFRNPKVLNNATYVAKLLNYDSVIGVREEGDLTYRKVNGNLRRIIEDDRVRFEREKLFKRQGGFALVNKEFLFNSNNIIGGKAGYILIGDKDALEIAEIRRVMELIKNA